MSTNPAEAAGTASATPQAGLGHNEPEPRICVECGGEFYPPAKGPGQHKKFCDRQGKGACKQAFANRERAQGALIISHAKVWHMNRHGKTPEARQARGDAMAEIGRVLRILVAEDKAAGRAARLPGYCRTLANVDDSYQERRRR